MDGVVAFESIVDQGGYHNSQPLFNFGWFSAAEFDRAVNAAAATTHGPGYGSGWQSAPVGDDWSEAASTQQGNELLSFHMKQLQDQLDLAWEQEQSRHTEPAAPESSWGEKVAGVASFIWDSVKLWDNAKVGSDYNNLREAGYSRIGAAYGAAGNALGEKVGVSSLLDAIEGRNQAGQQLSVGQRVWAGAMGAADLAGSGVAVVKAAGIGFKVVVRNVSVVHSTRKGALEAATHAHVGKPRPTRPKSDAAKRRAYEEQQKYKQPESHSNSEHPESHFHDSNESTMKYRHHLNRHHTYSQ